MTDTDRWNLDRLYQPGSVRSGDLRLLRTTWIDYGVGERGAWDGRGGLRLTYYQGTPPPFIAEIMQTDYYSLWRLTGGTYRTLTEIARTRRLQNPPWYARLARNIRTWHWRVRETAARWIYDWDCDD